MGALARIAGSNPSPAPITRPPGGYTPTPEGVKAWEKLQKRLAKRQAAEAQKAKGKKAAPPKPTPTDPSGTGGPNDPAWKSLANLMKNGLPG